MSARSDEADDVLGHPHGLVGDDPCAVGAVGQRTETTTPKAEKYSPSPGLFGAAASLAPSSASVSAA
jgi:hypothetical protein